MDNEKIKLTPPKLAFDLRRKIAIETYGALFIRVMGLIVIADTLTGVIYEFTKSIPALRGFLIAVLWIATVVAIVILGHRQIGRYRSWVKEGKFHVSPAPLPLHILSPYEYSGMLWPLKAPYFAYYGVFRFGDSPLEPYYAEMDEMTRATDGDEYYVVVFDEEPSRPRVIYRADSCDYRR